MGILRSRARTHVALASAVIAIGLVGFVGAEVTHPHSTAEARWLGEGTRAEAAGRLTPVDTGARQIVMRPPYDLSHRSIGLTCGYHESCKRLPWRTPPYLTGKAIDWDDNGGTVPNSRAVYFTASAQATTTAPIALVTFRFYPAGSAPQYPCHTLVATVHNYADRAPLFTVVYEHVRPLPNLHSLVVRGNGAGPLSLNRAHATPATSVPNVVARIGTMADDPCPYYQRDALGRPLYHAHVGAGTVARNVGFWMNTERWSSGIRAIPDANGCGAACTSTYPGPRWRLPYWQLWTYMWHWQVRVPTGRIA